MLKLSYHLNYAGSSDVGLVRERNEDAWKALPEKRLFLLADGMGGHKGGDVAARLAVEKVGELFFPPEDEDSLNKVFSKIISDVNTLIYEKGLEQKALTGMGTTLCCLYFHEEKALCVHVGDSRIYRLRRNRLSLLTQDHSLINQIQANSKKEIDSHSLHAYRHILTRAIGTNNHVEATIKSFAIEENDLYLLCSDGLTNFLSHEELQNILTQKHSIEEKASLLIELAKQYGGADNITTLLVHVQKNSSLS